MSQQLKPYHKKCTRSAGKYNLRMLKRQLSNYSLFLIVILFMVTSFYFNKHIHEVEFPHSGYPLSAYNVDAFNEAKAAEEATAAAVTGHANSNGFNTWNENKYNNAIISHANGDNNVHDNIKYVKISGKDSRKNIYGPLEPQPADPFEPFNAHSLLLVSGMFLLSFLLLC